MWMNDNIHLCILVNSCNASIISYEIFYQEINGKFIKASYLLKFSFSSLDEDSLEYKTTV